MIALSGSLCLKNNSHIRRYLAVIFVMPRLNYFGIYILCIFKIIKKFKYILVDYYGTTKEKMKTHVSIIECFFLRAIRIKKIRTHGKFNDLFLKVTILLKLV